MVNWGIVAIGHWETLNGHGGKVRLILISASQGSVKESSTVYGGEVCQPYSILTTRTPLLFKGGIRGIQIYKY